MKFSGIDMQGYFKAEIVLDVSALAHSASDERRIVYDDVTKFLWVADSSEWKQLGKYNNIPEGSEMWVYADAPPDGWSLSATTGDTLVAIKGGTTYTTGHTIAGSFTTPAHSHALGGHTHVASGVTGGPTSTGHDSETGGGSTKETHTHPFSITSGGPTTTTSIDGSVIDSYRPRSRVGIICTR